MKEIAYDPRCYYNNETMTFRYFESDEKAVAGYKHLNVHMKEFDGT